MTELRIPLGIPDLEILSQSLKGEILLSVRSTKTCTPCHKCGKPATIRYGHAPEMTIRHLPILDTPVYLVIRPVRYKCAECEGNVTTAEVFDWVKRDLISLTVYQIIYCASLYRAPLKMSPKKNV